MTRLAAVHRSRRVAKTHNSLFVFRDVRSAALARDGLPMPNAGIQVLDLGNGQVKMTSIPSLELFRAQPRRKTSGRRSVQVGIYSGAEIFEIAMELEEAGRVFYETLAEEAEDHDLADLCRNLATQESNHYRKFKVLSAELVERPASRPVTWDELHFARILIEERVLSDPDAAREAALSGDVAALLETAIRLEKDSVLFYSELLNEVDEKDIPAIQGIIDEEKRHVCALVEVKNRLKS